ncbi:hypothetical protein HDU87_001718 [Geranomyces variabilis]|uniref:Chitin-binding type-4 domain-containing protein n=1 Tax=Geranomyces variabilis TaxID=109894 RepID=A0AAD5TGK4_9FUNG|nr:hypothetical protein HDU87_001718 [Geranomyces variabilis]
MHATTFLALALSATGVLGHGFITSPTPRLPGPNYLAACGTTISNTQEADKGGNIQDLLNKRDSGFDPAKCNLWLCKGYQAEAGAPVLGLRPGQVLPIQFDIRAPHTGTANMSVVDLKTNTVIGKELIYFADFASTHHTIPDSNRNFQVTIPDLGNKCAAAGDCTLQFYWDSREANQTYESCIDFTQSGSAAPAPAPEPTTTAEDAPAMTTPAMPPTVPTTPPVIPEAPPAPSPTSIDSAPSETTTPAAPIATPTTAPSTAGRDCTVLVPQCWAATQKCWDDSQAVFASKGVAAGQSAQAVCGKMAEGCQNLNCSWTLTGRKLRA